ncbi:MAG TPA: hypothetical protein VI432_01735 [Candidatus Paceibacterota bacterium]
MDSSVTAANSNELNGSDDAKEVLEGLNGYFRNEEQAYLTFPEWYIVYSADEYANFIINNPPSKFPYFRSIGQYWNSYCNIYSITRDNYPFNFGYHVVLFVIGNSYSIENVTKGIYENTIGRIAELISANNTAQEDAYAQKVASEYGKFIHTIPWYEFPFKNKLKELWSETDFFGPNFVRKLERKIILSIEYGFKSIYSWIIKSGAETAYTPQDLEIYAIVKNLSDNILKQNPRTRLVTKIDSELSIILLTRYEEFTQTVPTLTRQGVQFVEIAGNDKILISVIAPNGWDLKSNNANALFSMKILTEPNFERVAISVSIEHIHSVLLDLESEGIKLEHIYDY